MTSPVRSAGATIRPAACETSPFRSARRERRCRAPVLESRAIRLRLDRRAHGRPRRHSLCGAVSPALRSLRGWRLPRGRSHARFYGSWNGRVTSRASCGKQPFLRRRRPSPFEIRIGVAGDAVGADQRQRAAREQDGGDHRRASTSARKAAAGGRPATRARLRTGAA